MTYPLKQPQPLKSGFVTRVLGQLIRALPGDECPGKGPGLTPEIEQGLGTHAKTARRECREICMRLLRVT